MKSDKKAKPAKTTAAPAKLVSLPAKAAFKADDFPQLGDFLSGYLHEDYKEEHGSLDGALGAFCDDVTPAKFKALGKELDALIALAATAPFKQVQSWLVDDLGSGWQPVDKNALLSLQRMYGKTDRV